MAKALIFIHGFPELGQRCVWLINRLPESGFDVEIITNQHAKEEGETRVLKQLSSKIRIHQVAALNKAPFRVFSRFFGWRKLAAWLEKMFFFPDLYILAIPFAVWRGWRIIRSSKVDVIMTVSPPESFHLAGWMLQKFTGVPWVANFEDLWTDKEHVFAPPTPIHRWLGGVLERCFYRDCAHLIANTQGNRDLYSSKYQIPAEKMTVITLGYEDSSAEVSPSTSEFSPSAADKPLVKSAPSAPAPPKDRLVLGYMGAFDKAGFPWKEWLEVMQVHQSREGHFPIELRFCGRVSKGCEEYIRDNGLQDYFIFEGLLPHHGAVDKMKSVDVLVVLMYETPYSWAIMPQKVYHYLSVLKPILGIGELKGEVNRILEQTDSGKVYPLAQREQLQAKLWEYAEEKRREGVVAHHPNRDEIAKYSIPSIARRLGQCMSEVVSRGRKK